MATVKELITRFGFEIDDKGLHNLEEGIHAAKDGLLGLGVIAGGAAVTLFGLVKHAADAKEELYHLSQRLGIGVEELRQLGFQGKLVGMSLDEMTMSLTFLNRNIENAKTGSPELRKAFRQVGISGEQLRSGSINAGNALEVLAKKFAVLPDGPKKVALAMEIFGRGGARMIPLLNGMKNGLTPLQKEVMGMGHATLESAKMGEEFNQALTLLEIAVGTVGKKIGTQLMPVAREVIDQMTRWVVQNKDLIKTNVTGFVNALTASLRVSIRFADIFVQSLSGLAHGFGGIEFAVKSLLIFMSILSGASLLIGIGKLIQAVVLLGNSFAIANLKAAAIPLAIGAAFVALLLIMEDIYSFFSGKDSFLGDLLSALPEVGKAFKAVFEPIFEPFVAFVTMLTDGFSSWADIFLKLGEILVNVILTPIRAILSSVATLASFLGRLTGSTTLQNFAAGAQNLGDNATASGIGGALAGAGGLGISARTALAGVGGGRSQEITLGGVTQEFNFPPGTDPAVVGDKISTATSDGLQDVLRNTSQATSSGGAY